MTPEVSKAEKLANTIQQKAPFIMSIPAGRNLVEDLRIMHSSPAAYARVQSKLKPYFFLKDLKQFHRTAPKKYAGGVILNILGYQIFRTLFHSLRWKLRRLFTAKSKDPKVQEAVDTLDKYGVAIINDLYTMDEAQTLVDEFHKLDARFTNHFPEFKEGVVSTSCTPCWTEAIPSEACQNLVVKNERLNEILEKVSGIEPRYSPEVSFLEYKANVDDLGRPHVDGQDNLHADVVYPSYKAFIYLGDVDKKSGAFHYASGTHKLTLRRIWLEYRCSVRHYLEPFFKTGNGPVDIEKNEFAKLGIQESPQEGRAGTVVIFNTMGFHRRGDFLEGGKNVRRLIHSNYRYLDSLTNRFSGTRRELW